MSTPSDKPCLAAKVTGFQPARSSNGAPCPNVFYTPTAPHSLWQNPIVERVNGTFRRECLNHVIILNERHLRTVLTDYIDNYYNVSRTHMSLNKDSPVPRPVQLHVKFASKSILGGPHHAYTRVA